MVNPSFINILAAISVVLGTVPSIRYQSIMIVVLTH